MSDIDERKFHNALWKCLDHCDSISDVRPKITVFLDELRGAGDWEEDEIQKVEIAVLDLLRRIIGDRSDLCAITNEPAGDSSAAASNTIKMTEPRQDVERLESHSDDGSLRATR